MLNHNYLIKFRKIYVAFRFSFNVLEKKNFSNKKHTDTHTYSYLHHQVTLTALTSLTLSLSIHPYHLSLPASRLNNILLPQRAYITS